MYGEPVLLVRYWPTRFGRYDLQNIDGRPDEDAAKIKVEKFNHGFGYSLKFPGCGVWTEQRYTNECRPVRCEELPFPCPKVRVGIPTRYRDGRWEKCLKTGWQPA